MYTSNRASQGIDKFGFNVDGQNNILYREWAPNAKEAYLMGDFSKKLSAREARASANMLNRWLEPGLSSHDQG